MLFAYSLGRRYPEYDFFLAVKGKKEQFRARNSIVEEALRTGCDYLFMLDDDHIIDIDDSMLPSPRYMFLKTLLSHMEEDPTKGIVGALYYQKDYKNCLPVIMQKERSGVGYFCITHAEITGRLQKVDVAGGGAMLVNMKIFDKIESPWFGPEFEFGTDVQICRKSVDAGFSVWVDTSIEIGHTRTEKEVITSKQARRVNYVSSAKSSDTND